MDITEKLRGLREKKLETLDEDLHQPFEVVDIKNKRVLIRVGSTNSITKITISKLNDVLTELQTSKKMLKKDIQTRFNISYSSGAAALLCEVGKPNVTHGKEDGKLYLYFNGTNLDQN